MLPSARPATARFDGRHDAPAVQNLSRLISARQWRSLAKAVFSCRTRLTLFDKTSSR